LVDHETELLWGEGNKTNACSDFHHAPLSLLLLDHVTAIGPRWRELTQLMADHVFSNVDRHVATTVVDSNRVADHLRENRAGATPGSDNRLLAFLVQPVDLLEQLGVNKWPLLE